MISFLSFCALVCRSLLSCSLARLFERGNNSTARETGEREPTSADKGSGHEKPNHFLPFSVRFSAVRLLPAACWRRRRRCFRAERQR